MEESTKTTTSTILSFLLFTTSVLTFCSQKQKKKKKNVYKNLDLENDYDHFLLDEKNNMFTYDQLIQLRNTYYSKSCSVSYSNTGPLVIIGVSIQYFYAFNQFLFI